MKGFNKFIAENRSQAAQDQNIEDIDTCFDEFVNQSISGSFSFQQISPSLVSSHFRRRGYKGLQRVTRGYKRLHWVIKGYRE